MLLLTPGAPEHTRIALRTRLDRSVDNLQPWSYSTFEWDQLYEVANRYERAGATRLGELCPVYNCHGLTFGSRRTQVDESKATIGMILDDDGFTEIPEPRTMCGDVVVYYDSNGAVTHSGIVVGRVTGGDLKVPLVWSKWGKGHEWLHPLGTCPYDASQARFYRITKWRYDEVFKQNS